jgi:hypothetical protein
MSVSINCILWKWKQPGFIHSYTSEHVNVMHDMIRRNQRHMKVRIICVTDDPVGIDSGVETFPLWKDFENLPNRSGKQLPSCYRRLKIFNPETQAAIGIMPGERICSLDLDSIITNDMTSLWNKTEHFVGWAVRGNHHLRVFNGSMFMFTAGENTNIWSRFDPVKTPDQVHRAGFLGSDQSWLSYNFARDPTAGTWAYPQAVSYPKEVARRPQLSPGVSIVMFHGKRKPWHADVQKETPWVARFWRFSEPSTPPGIVKIVANGAQAVTA